MALQDDYIKTALRLPRDLHKRVQESADARARSMNAEIVARLDDSFAAPDTGALEKRVSEVELRLIANRLETENNLAAGVRAARQALSEINDFLSTQNNLSPDKIKGLEKARDKVGDFAEKNAKFLLDGRIRTMIDIAESISDHIHRETSDARLAEFEHVLNLLEAETRAFIERLNVLEPHDGEDVAGPAAKTKCTKSRIRRSDKKP